MGNVSNLEQWAVRERLAFVERVAWWRGAVNRGDLREVFGISSAQASADLQLYLELNPGSMAYNLKTKRYESSSGMPCVLHGPRLEEGVRQFLGEVAPVSVLGTGLAGSRVDLSAAPMRKASPVVERHVFLSLLHRQRLRIRYWSVRSSRDSVREIAPHALGHDGYRWYVRAWCFEDSGFKDFVLSRIERADWPGAPFLPGVRDEAWENFVDVILVPNQSLDELQRRTIERDYGMEGGHLRFRVREAMLEYCLAHLRVRGGVERPEHLELAGPPQPVPAPSA
ncbi:MAG: putative DNA-binding transcriptional regulator YafY [Verrucomicrobia bacterium]|nr:MAG: putative DNA-binding transcriptional regulator YafY [Verrucomicrobiota bacterium]